MKKIALIGTHGTGKTIIAHDLVSSLKKRGKNAEYLGEIARDAPGPINEDIDIDTQKWIILSQMTKEIEIGRRNPEYLICDRSVIDGYCYHLWKFGRDPGLESLVLDRLRTYSALFRVPINEAYLMHDGVRSTKKEFQKEIDTLFSKFIREHGVGAIHYSGLQNA